MRNVLLLFNAKSWEKHRIMFIWNDSKPYINKLFMQHPCKNDKGYNFQTHMYAPTNRCVAFNVQTSAY